MADPFVAEIRIFAGNFAPRGWAFCDGQLLPINQNTALFSLLGTTYGGNGTTTFALPDLRGRSPMHHGQGPGLSSRDLGEAGGETAVALAAAELPLHSHTLQGVNAPGNQAAPAGHTWAEVRGALYAPTAGGQLHAAAVGNPPAPHTNMPPYLSLNFIIALEGVFPPRS